MKTAKPRKKTRAELERVILEVKAQMAHTYHFATATLNTASMERLNASGVLLQLTFLGGKEVIPPVVIRGGLSPETLAAIRADLHRSYEETILFKPTSK